MNNNISNYCLHNPKPQVEQLFENLDLTGKFFMVIDCMAPDIQVPGVWTLIPAKFPEALFLEKFNYAKENNLEFHLIFESIYEAPCYYDSLKLVIDYVSKKYNIPLKDIIIVSGAQHQFNAPVKNCPVLAIMGFPSMFEKEVSPLYPTHHFISLARNSKTHRILVTKKIWERGLDKFGYCSLGCIDFDFTDKEEVEKLLGHLYSKYPAILDGVVREGDMQNSADDPRISGAFVNVAMETSYEKTVTPRNWTAPFWTEKTTKPFVWKQIPLILGPLNNLEILRDFKFDLFEDVIDTSYDKEADPIKRIDMYVEQLEKICQWPIEKCCEFKKKNMHRFNYNRELAINVYHNQAREYNFKNLTSVLGVARKS